MKSILWLQRLNPFKQKWALVKVLTWDVGVDTAGTKGQVFLHLFESENGNRKYDVFASTQIPDLRTQITKLSIYHNTIAVWMAGRYLPDVPRYNEVDSDDVAIKLSKP